MAGVLQRKLTDERNNADERETISLHLVFCCQLSRLVDIADETANDRVNYLLSPSRSGDKLTFANPPA